MHVYNTTIAGIYVDGVTFADNNIVASGGLRMMYVPSAETQGAKGLVFTGNTYDSSGSTPNFVYASKTYYSLSSLQGGTGEEKGASFSNALVAFPAFASPSASIALSSGPSSESVSLAAIFNSTKISGVFAQAVAGTPAGHVAK
jgi:hypothetical protein